MAGARTRLATGNALGRTAAFVLVLVMLAMGCTDEDAAPDDTAADPGQADDPDDSDDSDQAGDPEQAGDADEPGDAATSPGEPTDTLRLGYFPNVTHATAIVGVEEGFLAEALGDGATLETATFNAGDEAIEALLSGAIDVTFIGPNPAIDGFAQSQGEAVRVVAGATSGGASLVVRDGIQASADFAGTTLSTPALGNTQDVALRAWLLDEGFETSAEGGEEISIRPQDNAQILEAFRGGEIDGAWVPEPWATLLVDEGGGNVLIDERDLWPDGRFVTTHLIVSTEFIEQQPDVVERLLAGHVAATDFVNERPDEAQAVVIDAIEAITGTSLATDTVAESWENLEFTVDPIASSLQASANDAAGVELLEPVDLDGIYDLTLLNDVLAEQGREHVSG